MGKIGLKANEDGLPLHADSCPVGRSAVRREYATVLKILSFF
jgi:hypothetical protein